MTLSEWEKKYGRYTELANGGIRYIIDNLPNKFERAALWHLSDYTVSSISGGTIWLIKKE